MDKGEKSDRERSIRLFSAMRVYSQQHVYALSLDKDSSRIYKDGKEISLTGREFLLLSYFMENANKIISKDRLYEQVWEESGGICDNTIMVHIRHLREKIEEMPSNPKLLITVKGLGYKLKKRVD